MLKIKTMTQDVIECPLPFPERFYAAVQFATDPPQSSRQVTDETRLLLYALYQQVMVGPNYEPKPYQSFWSSSSSSTGTSQQLEQQKWQAWSSLQDMDAKEAMGLYVHTMEEENENWWLLLTNDLDPEDTQISIENARRWAMEMGWGADRSLLSPSSITSQRGGGGGGGGGQPSQQQHQQQDIITPPMSPPMPGRIGRNGTSSNYHASMNNNNNNNNNNDNNASTSQIFSQQQQQQQQQQHRDSSRNLNASGSSQNKEHKQLQMYGGGSGALVVGGDDENSRPWFLQTKEAHESIATAREDGNWTSLGTSTLGSALTPRSSRSHARHGHAAYAVGNKMIVIGGNTAGTVRSDVIALDCRSLQWEQVECTCVQPGANFTPRHGHAVCAVDEHSNHQTELLVCGGFTKDPNAKNSRRNGLVKAQEFEMWILDLSNSFQTGISHHHHHHQSVMQNSNLGRWTKMTTNGKGPCARGGHTASRCGENIVIFGGETPSGQCLADCWLYHVTSRTWTELRCKGWTYPSPRRGHCATSYINTAGAHFVYVFGGSTSSGCVNSEVYALDVKACRWRKANPEGGFMPQPRSGAASARLGDTWYVVGGGNSEGGCVDTVALTLRDPLSAEPAWAETCRAAPASAVASESGTCIAIPEIAALVSFGGYDGVRDRGDCSISRHPQFLMEQSASAAKDHLLIAGKAPITSTRATNNNNTNNITGNNINTNNNNISSLNHASSSVQRFNDSSQMQTRENSSNSVMSEELTALRRQLQRAKRVEEQLRIELEDERSMRMQLEDELERQSNRGSRGMGRRGSSMGLQRQGSSHGSIWNFIAPDPAGDRYDWR